jgi:hypothetical protein
MPLTSLGRSTLSSAWLTGLATPYLCVGDGTATFDPAHTDLQGSNKTRMPMDATYPVSTANVGTFRATFGPGDGNHAWSEWGLATAASGANLQQRKVESLGTKAPGATWEFTVADTWT